MSVKEQFYNKRPLVLFDPRGSQRIDPRFRYSRPSAATYFDINGVIRTAAVGEPRFAYDPATRTLRGVLREQQSTNQLLQSQDLTSTPWGATSNLQIDPAGTIAPDGTLTGISVSPVPGSGTVNRAVSQGNVSLLANKTYTFSFYVKCLAFQAARGITIRIGLNDGTEIISAIIDLNQHVIGSSSVVGSAFKNPRTNYKLVNNGWYQLSITFEVTSELAASVVALWYSNFGGSLDTAGTYFLWGLQLEVSDFSTSYIPTTTVAVTRSADLLSLENTFIPQESSAYIDSQLDFSSESTLISLANASNEKVNLDIKALPATFNSPALVYEIADNKEITLPIPVPLPGDQRNIITFGDVNTHYQVGYSRKSPAFALDVPSNLTKIGIGHDVTDPSRGFNGTISRFYLWSGEIPPEIARGLVRGDFILQDTSDVQAVNPDALALIFNTQGAELSGDTEIVFRIHGTPNDITIDWGDGVIESYTGVVTVAHIYAVPGVYLVQITGALVNIRFGGADTNNQGSDLLAITQNNLDWQPTNLDDAFNGASGLQSASLAFMPSTSLVTTAQRAWLGCSSLTTFPLLDFSNTTNLSSAWRDCAALTTFPLINTSNVTGVGQAWQNCPSLQSFPLIDTGNVTNFTNAWRDCLQLTSFPAINTSKATNISTAWRGCSGLTAFPSIDTSNVTNASGAWQSCTGLTSFPLLDLSKCTNLGGTWSGCSLTSFPLIDTSSCTNFNSTFGGYAGSSFPVLDTSKGTNFSLCWNGCQSLISFPELDFSSAEGLLSTAVITNTGFYRAWSNCPVLASFPANRFDTVAATNFFDAFSNCALSAQSIENILVSINTANTSNGILTLSGGTNAQKVNWTTDANDAYDALIARGWTITFRA
jgi:hypothetical protein